MDLTALYESCKALENPGFWQDPTCNFTTPGSMRIDRWQLYLQGLLTTLEVTVLALIAGRDPGRGGGHRSAPPTTSSVPATENPVLGIVNVICKIYATVIRGTPMMVQLLIMGLCHLHQSSRNFTMVGALSLGINSGAYVAEIVRGGLMSLDPGQSEAGRSLGLGLSGHHALYRHSPGLQGHPARPGQ